MISQTLEANKCASLSSNYRGRYVASKLSGCKCNTYPCPESRPSGAETTITNLRSFLNRTKQEKRRNNNKKSAAFFRSAFRSRERHRLLFLFRSITLRVTVRNPRIRSSFPHFVLESAVLLRQQLTEDFLDGRLLFIASFSVTTWVHPYMST
ncbi:hypothetical protein AB3S75_011720 [Citrus x aurantiifolia]